MSQYHGNVWWNADGIPRILNLLHSWQAFLEPIIRRIILEDKKPIMPIPRIEPRFPGAHHSDHSLYTLGRQDFLS